MTEAFAKTQPESGPPTFLELVAAAVAGDEWAFERIITPLLPQLQGYLRAQARNDAEDLLGDVLLRAFRSLDRFEGTESQFRSWVFTIARHRVVDHRRRFRRRDRLETVSQPARGGNAEEEAVSNLVADELRRVLALLAPSQRQVLLLRVVADLSVEETAQVMGRTPGAVKVLQHRALEAVRKKIRKEV